MFCILYLIFSFAFYKNKIECQSNIDNLPFKYRFNFITGYLHVAVSYQCFCSNFLAFTIRLQNNKIIKNGTPGNYRQFSIAMASITCSLLTTFTLEDDFNF